jgi:hypothetical protein
MPTENDKAWEKYIADMHLQLDGRHYEVSAEKLKAVTGREPRLLAKFDSQEQLPAILKRNGYALLAVTNGSYKLLKANIFASIPGCPDFKDFQPETDFPLLTAGRSFGEMDFLDNAYNTGLLSDFVEGEKLYQTIRGRERSRSFSFRLADNDQMIEVDGVQIEVDAGYEGERDVILIEAKIGARKSFNIRQLYYPYRHFSQIVTTKRIRPMFFEYDVSRATYTLYEYRFADALILNSIQLARCCVYALSKRIPRRFDELVDASFETTSNIVPQADDLNKVLEIVTLVNDGQGTASEISDYFVFDVRQSSYYGEAAEYLGLITRRRGEAFDLTVRGVEFLTTPPEQQQTFIAKVIINSWVFRELVKRIRRKGFFTVDDVDSVIALARKPDGTQHYSHTTIPRRRQTILQWINWLTEQIGCFAIADGKVRLA